MKYFVSIENTSYFYWQIELLIESFKMQGLENDLYIAIAENECSKLNTHFKNITSHKNIYLHENIGRERGYLPLNRIYSLEKLTREGVLTYPFTLIHSDMVLRKPISIEKYKKFNIITNTYQTEEEEINSIINFEEIKQNLISSNLLNSLDKFYYSHPIVFNHQKEITDSFKENFFKYLIYEIEVMLLNKKNKANVFEKAAWKKTLLNATGHYDISGDVFSCNITDDLDVPFIHYSKGIPPIFNKKFFKYEDKKVLLTNIDDPLRQLSILKDTSAHANFVAKVIESYLEK